MKKVFLLLFMVVGLITLVACETQEFKESSEIKVYTRDATSGTRDGFFSGIEFSEAVKDNSVLKNGYIEVEGNGDIINGVKNDIYGLGYISLSSLEGSTLKALDMEGVAPSEANVINGTYSLKRNFNYMVRTSYEDETIEALVEAFVAYMGTVERKATIQNNDEIVDIASSDVSWDDIKAEHPVTQLDNSNVVVKFGGSNSVLKIAQALSRDFVSSLCNFHFKIILKFILYFLKKENFFLVAFLNEKKQERSFLILPTPFLKRCFSCEKSKNLV